MNVVFNIGWALSRFTGSVLMGAKVSGREHAPRNGGAILAPNHISYLDPPLTGCYIPRHIHFFAKKELFDIPVLGWLVKAANSHPVRRSGFDRQAIETAIDVLRTGHMLTVFPEGTRGRQGKFLEPKAGVGRIAREALVPIVPCFIHNADKFTKCLTRRCRLLISYGEPISAEWIGGVENNKDGWNRIALEVMRRIKDLKRQTLGGADSVDVNTTAGDREALSI